MELPLDRRPVMVALAGPNGAGKSTFYHAHLHAAGLRFVNADVLARELKVGPYEAAEMADAIRCEMLELGESFVFETVFSDPVKDKLSFLKDAARSGYTVILCFIGISGPNISEERVAMRVSQGGHDVATEKLKAGFPRVVANLEIASREMPLVWIFDNDDLRVPFRLVTVYQDGRIQTNPPLPKWLRGILPGVRGA